MAKVLACPNCGHKHPLNLLVGLDTFICRNCEKKLSVPTQNVNQSENKNAEVVVVAHSNSETLPPQIVQETSGKSTDDVAILDDQIQIVAQSSEKLSGNAEVVEEPELDTKKPQLISRRQTFKKPSFIEKLSEDNKGLPVLGNIGKILAWIVAIPTAFVIVVILPRIFGGGFRASSLVSVITQQGLGRFKIVVLLIVLWAFATVICLHIYMNLMQRFVRRKLNS